MPYRASLSNTRVSLLQCFQHAQCILTSRASGWAQAPGFPLQDGASQDGTLKYVLAASGRRFPTVVSQSQHLPTLPRSGEPTGSKCMVGAKELLALGPPACLVGVGSLSDFLCGCHCPRKHIVFGNTRCQLSRTTFDLHQTLFKEQIFKIRMRK